MSPIPFIKAFTTSTIEWLATTILAPRAVSPIDKASTPAPASAHPTPNNAIAPLNAYIAGMTGRRIAAAAPKTANTPAKASRPLAISPKDSLARDLRIGVNKANAKAATNIAAEPPKVPFIAFRPAARITMAPPRVIRPFPIPSQDIWLIDFRDLLRIVIAVATPIKPMDFEIIPLGSNFIAIDIDNSEPPRAVRPLAIPAHESLPISVITPDSIFIDAARRTRPIPVEITCFTFFVRLVKAESSRSSPPTAARPLPTFSQLMPANVLQTDASTLREVERTKIPRAVDMAFFVFLVILRKIESSSISPPTPAKPFPSSSQLRAAKSLQTEANIFIAAAKITS